MNTVGKWRLKMVVFVGRFSMSVFLYCSVIVLLARVLLNWPNFLWIFSNLEHIWERSKFCSGMHS